MLTLLVGVVTIAILIGICYGIGSFVNSHDHPIAEGGKILTLIGWFLLISYGIGWMALQIIYKIM
jgi:hypothetical protein